MTLAPGTYNTRFVITEESFHNPVNARGQGGYWKTVLASEDYIYNAEGDMIGHDTDPRNDLIFTIGDVPEMREMQVQVTGITGQKNGNKWKAKAQIYVRDRLNRPMRDVQIQGVWSGPTNTIIAQGKTGNDGRGDGFVTIESPEAEAKSGDVFQFTVTKVTKVGRTWNYNQFPAAAAKVP